MSRWRGLRLSYTHAPLLNLSFIPLLFLHSPSLTIFNPHYSLPSSSYPPFPLSAILLTPTSISPPHSSSRWAHSPSPSSFPLHRPSAGVHPHHGSRNSGADSGISLTHSASQSTPPPPRPIRPAPLPPPIAATPIAGPNGGGAAKSPQVRISSRG